MPAVLTPFDRSAAAPGTGRLWRKRVLPVGDIDYKGRTLHFTRAYNDSLAAAFAQRAYDQVPFQLADAANSHTNDPERFRGDVVDMESRGDGLWITVAPSAAGEQTLLTNPVLGVSARIVEDYARSDGKHFPAAIQHVLGTLDPRIPGLGAWQAIEAANDDKEVLDLTGAQFSAKDGDVMPELNEDQMARLARLLEIPADKIDQLIAATAPLTDAELAALTGDTPQGTELSDAELDELVAAAAELDAAGQLEPEAEPAVAGLSAEAQMALEMANYRADEADRQLGIINQRFAAEQFEREKVELATQHGIPPYIAELARPVLEGSGHFVDLSNDPGKQVDAGQVMRQVLHEIGRSAQLLDLGIEMGSPMDADPDASQAAEARSSVVDRFKSQTGL
jgi:hypothetical protein